MNPARFRAATVRLSYGFTVKAAALLLMLPEVAVM
jgi:hypothetical protein